MTHNPTPAPVLPDSRERTRGGIYAFSAYVLWGFMPLYFTLLAPSSPWEVVAWRILLALVFCAILIPLTRSWHRLGAILRRPRLLLWTAVAGVLIYVNWQTFLIGSLTDHVIETSLGYFINPIVTVLLGVLVLHERLRPLQWVAIGLAAIAVAVIIFGYGNVPWISFILAFSFGTYGLVKNKIGPSVDALSGLTLESAWLVPVALVQMVIVANTLGLTYGSVGVTHTVLLSLSGVITAVPLLMFAAGARRIPLSVVGILQFVAPIMQFITGAWLLGEPMPTERWIGFGIVWVSLVILSVDSVRASRRPRAHDDAPSDVTELT